MEQDLSGRRVVISGANSGLGFVTARELARMGASVTLVCRSQGKGEIAQGQIKEATGRDTSLELADFASLQSVRELAERLGAIDVLVNNAGMMQTRRMLSADGHELMFAVNHLAPFLLTHLLLPKLEGRARVVNVASRAHRRGKLDLDDLDFSKRRFDGMAVYSTSKLCNMLFNLELARRLEEEDSAITSNCLHPGVIATGFGRDNSGLWRLILGLVRPLMTSVDQGAETQIWLASSPDVQGVTGEYFVDCKITAPTKQARDPLLARALWDKSAELVGI
ncbi:MAG TPA: SDR family oxidoreductase [Myxococcota bacterium]|nr:SDR family oxidoreductase [Myxococcota bacterium]